MTKSLFYGTIHRVQYTQEKPAQKTLSKCVHMNDETVQF